MKPLHLGVLAALVGWGLYQFGSDGGFDFLTKEPLPPLTEEEVMARIRSRMEESRREANVAI